MENEKPKRRCAGCQLILGEEETGDLCRYCRRKPRAREEEREEKKYEPKLNTGLLDAWFISRPGY
jgi:hypothetical protein